MTTVAIPGTDVAARIDAAFPGTVIEATEYSVTVPAERIVDVALFLRDDPEFDCKYLNTLLGVDWLDHFDVVYVLTSLARNHTLTLEARTSHNDPVVPSVSRVWQGAVLQEREVYDLMGISFSGHPDLKRIFLWEGFPGHPLRKDFLALPGGYKPGLQRFPYEFPEGQRAYPNLSLPDGPRAPSVPRLVSPLPGQREAEETGGGQLGVGGGGSTDIRTPRQDIAPPSDPPQIEAPAEDAESETEGGKS
jgi:NADH-quinone oxidoreductase subunit C